MQLIDRIYETSKVEAADGSLHDAFPEALPETHARTLAHRLANPYFNRLCSMAAMERESVVTTVKRWPSIEAK